MQRMDIPKQVCCPKIQEFLGFSLQLWISLCEGSRKELISIGKLKAHMFNPGS